MLRAAVLFAAPALALALAPQLGRVADDPLAKERQGVERAVRDYLEGFYEAKPELIERGVHPDLVKVGFWRRSPEEPWSFAEMTFEQAKQLAARYNADGTEVPADAPREIEILDVLDQTASAKLTAHWGVDFFHLAKFDGKWQIVQVLWQSPPAPAK